MPNNEDIIVFFHKQLARIKAITGPQMPVHSQGPRKPDLADQEDHAKKAD